MANRPAAILEAETSVGSQLDLGVEEAGAPPAWTRPERSLEALGLSIEDVDKILKENDAAYSVMHGASAELKLDPVIDSGRLTDRGKPKDHNRQKKGDRDIIYKGHHFRIEVKSLRISSITPRRDGGFDCKAQIRASDRRPVPIGDGRTVSCSSMLRSDLDVVAISFYSLGVGWRYGYVSSADLPAPAKRLKDDKKILLTDEEQNLFVSSSFALQWPIKRPVYSDLYELLDREVERRLPKSAQEARPVSISAGPPTA